MQVGHGRVDITPTEPFYLLGYKTPTRNQPALGVHDHIFINAILFQDDAGQACFLATGDLLELEDVVAADIKQRLHREFGIDQEQVIVGVTHDHHSVRDYHRTWEFGKFSQTYYDRFVESFVDAYRQCLDSAVEATASVGQQVITGFYGNRNHEGELSDNVVSVTRFSHEGEPFAAIVNLAVHSTVLPASNRYLTADLAGNTSTEIQKHWGFYPLMLIGCAGDSSNRFFRSTRDFDELAQTAHGLGKAIAEIKPQHTVALGAIHKLSLAYEVVNDKPTYDAELKDLIHRMQAGKLTHLGSATVPQVVEKCREQLKQPQFHDLLALGFVDVGDLRFLIFPGELASAGGAPLRDSSDKTVLVAGYCNGFHYYFLQAKDYELSFETIGNPVPAGTFEAIIQHFESGSQLLDMFEHQRANESPSGLLKVDDHKL